ncbi:MAG: dihydroneopterin aldolase [Puniceicoccales bacterium]|jgi:dihydroneopterin aldolase|nr:dihydroneopterin aldolase [Puniceicoccales bacterium]
MAHPPTDKLRIHGIHAHGHHGTTPDEQHHGQPYSVTLELHLDTRPAATTDDLAHTINYAHVVQTVQHILQGPPTHLIETLAARIADTLLRTQPLLHHLTVTLTKPHPPTTPPIDHATIEITRARPPTP